MARYRVWSCMVVMQVHACVFPSFNGQINFKLANLSCVRSLLWSTIRALLLWPLDAMVLHGGGGGHCAVACHSQSVRSLHCNALFISDAICVLSLGAH